MKEFEQSQIDDGDMTLANYLQEIALYTDADTFSDASRVRLMTIHQSKGLEFPTVFVVGLTEGEFSATAPSASDGWTARRRSGDLCMWP